LNVLARSRVGIHRLLVGSVHALVVACSIATPVLATPADQPFQPGEQIDMAIDYLKVRAGQAHIAIGRPEGSLWPVVTQGRTDGVGSVLDIREHLVTYWDAEARQSRGSVLNSIEPGDRHTDRSRFDRERGQAKVETLRKGLTREHVYDVPADVHDLVGALLRLRLAALVPGAHLEFPVFSGEKTFTLRADVEGKEILETPAGRFPTVRVRVHGGPEGRFRTERASLAWFTDDERHVPVRMSADFAVGTVTATLTAYRPGSPYAVAP